MGYTELELYKIYCLIIIVTISISKHLEVG